MSLIYALKNKTKKSLYNNFEHFNILEFKMILIWFVLAKIWL